MSDSPSDSFRVNDVLRDFKEDLERFERKHDDSVKALFAYVTQPTSIDLLREHGFLMFDDAGNRRVDPEEIAVRNFEEYVSIEKAVSGCFAALREAQRLVAGAADLPSQSDGATGDDAPGDVSASSFENAAMKPVITHVTQQVANAVSGFDNAIQVAIDNALNATLDSERERAERIRSIWTARQQLARRFLVMAVLVGAVGYALTYFPSEGLTGLWDAIPQSVRYDAMVNIVAGLVLLVIAGLITLVWTGPSNPAAKAAFSSIIRLRLRTWWQRRKQRRQLHKIAVESLRTLPAGLSQLETACLSAITQWIQTENAEFVEVHGHLARVRERVSERAQRIGYLATTIAPWVAVLPKRLLERSEAIREEAIADHMTTIRDAANSVETLRANIVRIAENAELSAP